MTTATEHSPEYTAHLASPEWQLIRADKLARAGWLCERCGASGVRGAPLHVHHLTYERLGDEPPEDLLVVCPACHEDEDKKRAERTAEAREERIWDARVEGYARKRWGEDWFLNHDWWEADEALSNWLDERDEW